MAHNKQLLLFFIFFSACSLSYAEPSEKNTNTCLETNNCPGIDWSFFSEKNLKTLDNTLKSFKNFKKELRGLKKKCKNDEEVEYQGYPVDACEADPPVLFIALR